MSDILSDKAAYELAVGLAASQRIMLDALVRAGVLDRAEIAQAFHEKARDLIETHALDDAANVVRLIHREMDKPAS